LFSVKTGGVHEFVGKNGAGKYILMKIMTSVYRADEGDSYIENQKIKEILQRTGGSPWKDILIRN